MGLEDTPKPQITKDYKGQYIKSGIVAFVLIVLFVVVNAFIKKDNNNNSNNTELKTEIQKENSEINDSGMDNQNYYEKREESQEKPEEKNFVENDKNIQVNNIYQEQITRNQNSELLKAYYSKLIQEEEQARSSSIGFTGINTTGGYNNSNNNESSSSNNFQQQNLFSDSYTQQNMQGQKNEFLNKKNNKFYNSYQEESPISSYEVMAGTFIPATLITGINSDLPSNSVAIVREDVYDTVTGNFLLIPRGTKIIGTYDSGVSFGQNRLLIIWQRLLFPDGKYIGLDNMNGVDLSGYAGFNGKVNNHFIKLLQAVVLSSAMGAGTAIATENNNNDNWQSAAGQGAGQVILDFGNKMGEKILNRQPTIEIKQGYRFNIMVQSDLVLTPYNRR